MTNDKQYIAMVLVIILTMYSCSPSERQIREIVREELAGAIERKPILDAKTIGPYSPAQQAGNFLFISGQIGLNPQTGALENKDIETETKQVLVNLLAILNVAGCNSSDVISTTVYLKDIGDFAKMNAVYASFFQQGNYPARATVQVAALPKDARIEISAIAYRQHER